VQWAGQCLAPIAERAAVPYAKKTGLEIDWNDPTATNSKLAILSQIPKEFLLPIRIEHIVRLETLPMLHRDSFDRLLVAQALEEDVAILSSDRLLHQYPAKIVW
jgi:PIN domain nuclease of toxin-antitoxin system